VINGTKLIAVVARSSNHVIGSDGSLPWRIPADLQRVKRLTMGKPLIMGRRTFESLPGILPGRRHIVLTRDETWQHPGVQTAHTVDEAIAFAAAEEVIIFGGGEIYLLFWGMIDRLELTTVWQDIEGDTFFPKLDQADWIEGAREFHEAEGERPAFTFSTLDSIP
jgi:dihydrofolate reductase